MTTVIDDRALGVLREHDSELGQTVALLAAAGYDPEGLALGAGDRVLLGLHRALTGRDIDVRLVCGSCGAASEVSLGPASVPAWEPKSAPLGLGGRLREPTYADLADLPQDPATATAELLRRCTVGSPDRAPAPADLGLVDTTLTGPLVTSCPECGATMESPLDVQRLVLESLMRVLDEVDVEVHLLATAYGWELATIESLPRERRRRLARLVAEGR